MDIEQYWAKVAELMAEPEPEVYRTGQIHFNVLYTMRPDLTKLVREQGIDPYYDKHLLPAFKQFVAENW